ncbi:hypothetical protein ACH5RR_032421 [Cinchona calisaya]|uniref:Uncharacterized protein n=1 Tax=Cinchona calisaya TaxID=153742 RepID=A0ABD2YM54_9GENT
MRSFASVVSSTYIEIPLAPSSTYRAVHGFLGMRFSENWILWLIHIRDGGNRLNMKISLSIVITAKRWSIWNPFALFSIPPPKSRIWSPRTKLREPTSLEQSKNIQKQQWVPKPRMIEVQNINVVLASKSHANRNNGSNDKTHARNKLAVDDPVVTGAEDMVNDSIPRPVISECVHTPTALMIGNSIAGGMEQPVNVEVPRVLLGHPWIIILVDLRLTRLV